MKKKDRNHIDLLTLLAVLILMVMSLGVVYSASSTWAYMKWNDTDKLLGSHAVKVLLGFLAIFIFMHIDYTLYRKITKPMMIAGVVLLLGTLAMGGEVKGASRWLHLGGMSFQPSEFAKYALIFHLSALIAHKKVQVQEFKTGYLPLLIWIGVVSLLVLLQPNFSTGAMIVAISLVMLYVGQARLKHIALSFSAIIPLLLVYMLSAEYRMRRIMSFIQEHGGGEKPNYQLWQGIIGFGNGGVFGLGPGGSHQRDLFLPESYGDFVFSIVGEEYGLVGTIFIIGVFLLIMLRGIKIAKHARDDFGRLLALGITTAVTLYGLVNAGVTLGVLPTTGLPMPFVSYGGSSMLFSAIAIGVLLNISSQTDMHPRLDPTPGGVRPVEQGQPAVGKVY